MKDLIKTTVIEHDNNVQSFIYTLKKSLYQALGHLSREKYNNNKQS
jgi:hypothetical protein